MNFIKSKFSFKKGCLIKSVPPFAKGGISYQDKTMKTLFVVLNLLWAGAVCCAAPVDARLARQVASRVLHGVVTLHADAMAVEAKSRRGYDAPAYYVFSRENGMGFVVVSGEDVLPSVVAYSDDGIFPRHEEMHPGLVDFLEAYSALVGEVRQGETVVAERRRAEEAVPVVEPLCKTSWNQSAPYNALCPKDGTKTCPVGCVALAMAQIMKHHEWPSTGKGKVMYTPQGLASAGVLSVDFSESHYDWSRMLNTTAELNADPEAAAMVAKLCYDCGVSSRMMYAAAGSGTYDDYAIQSMYENFGYKASSIQIVYRDCYATQEEWDAIWKAELDAGRPVLYSGVSNGTDGHEFVVDGYDSNGYVHVNWGWGGSSDGYFDIAVLNATASQRYSEGQGMIIGIEPDPTGEDVVHAPVVPYMDAAFSLKGSLDLGKDKLAMVQNIYNRSRSGQTWFFGIGLYNLEGKLLKNLTVNEASKTINAMAGVGTSSVRFNIPADTPDGTYVVSAIFRAKGYEEWMLPNVVGGVANNKVYAEIKSGKATFGEIPAYIYNICVAEPHVVSHQYYDLSGRPLQNVTKGVVIDLQTLSDGRQRAVKVCF